MRLEDDAVVVLDQRRLPDEEVDLVCRSSVEVAEAIRTLAVRGAPAIGIAAAYGYALAARIGEDLDVAVAVLAASRPTAVNLTWALEEMGRWDGDPAERARRSTHEEVERCREMSAHAATLFEPGTRALTHCNAGGLATGGYGTAVGCAARGVGGGSARARARRRDAPAAPGRTSDGVGARGGRDSARGDRRLGRRVDDGPRRGRRGLHRRRPDRRERRHGEQDRDVHARGARSAPRDPALRRRAELDRRSRHAGRRRHPDRGATGGRGDGAIRGAEPGVRRHARGPDRGDRHGAWGAPRAVRRVARRGGAPREGDHPRRRVRDAPAAADRLDRKAAPSDRRAADDRLGLRPDRGGDDRYPRRHERPLRCRLRALGERAGRRRRPRRRHRRRTTTGSARSETSGSCSSGPGSDDDLLVVAGDNLFDFGAWSPLRSFGRREGLRAPSPSTTAGTSSSRRTTGSSRSDEDDRVVSVRGEAVGAAQHAGRHRRLPLRPRRTSRSSSAISRREIRRISPGDSSRGCARCSPSTATASRAPGTTSETPTSCSRRTTAGGSESACRRVMRTRR